MLTCSLSHHGNYWNHQCDKPQTHVAVFKSDKTMTGRFYAGRCEEHTDKSLHENSGIINLYADSHNKPMNTFK